MPIGKDGWLPTRTGQWVKVKVRVPFGPMARGETSELPPPWRAADGSFVGIHQLPQRGIEPAPGGKTRLVRIGQRVVLVAADGTNVQHLRDGKLVNFALAPDEIEEWAPLLDPADLPPGRPLADGLTLRP